MSYHQTQEDIIKESKLVKLAQQKPENFAPLYDRYYLQIFKYVFKRIPQQEEVGEITSDVFAKVIANIKQYKFQGLPFSSWLYRIASNEIVDHYRRKKAQKYVRVTRDQLNHLLDNSLANSTDAENGHLAGDLSEQEQIAKDRALKTSHMITLLGSLKDKELELVEMRFFEQKSFKQMGQILDVSEGNARMRTHRVLLKLRAQI